MEKPGPEPPPPAFPNKGLIEAGPAPGHTEPRAAGAPVGAEESVPSGLHGAGWQQSPHMSPPAAGWGSLSQGSVVGSAGGWVRGWGWVAPAQGSGELHGFLGAFSAMHPPRVVGWCGTTVHGGPSHVCVTVLGDSRSDPSWGHRSLLCLACREWGWAHEGLL